MWTAIRGFFGSSDGISKIVESVSSGLDMSFYTSEEKGIAHQKILDWKIKMATALGPQSISRRVLAFIIAGVWAYLLLLMVHLKLLGMESQADYIYKVLTDIVDKPFLVVVGFFFLAHIVRANK